MPSPVWWDGSNLKAWIGGILSTITLPSSGGSNGGSNIPFFPEVEDREFESLFIPKNIPSIINEITFTTTGSIDDLDFNNAPLIRMNNASDTTIRGLKAGYSGQRVTIVSIGAGHVFLAHQNTNSTAENRLINKATSGNTPLAAGTGYITYQYDATTLRWRLISHEQGAWLNVPYTSGDFTANGAMTWTVDSGDIIIFAYLLRGKTLFVVCRVFITTVGGVVSDQLLVTIPNSFTCVNGIFFVGRIIDNGTIVVSIVRSAAGGTVMINSRLDSANFTLSTNNTAVDFNAIFEVT